MNIANAIAPRTSAPRAGMFTASPVHARTSPRALPALALAVAVVLLLAGCTGATGATTPLATATTAPSAATSSPTVSVPPTSDDRLFTISATVRATDNTSLAVTLVGFSPVTSTSSNADSLAATLLDACSAAQAVSVSDAETPLTRESLARYGSSLLRIEYRASPVGHTFLAPLDLSLGSVYAARTATGTGLNTMEQNTTCTGHHQLTGSGSGTAVVDYESGTSFADNTKWSYGRYGFSVPFDSGATIEDCTITLTALATATVASVPGWQPGVDQSGIACGIGYVGE